MSELSITAFESMGGKAHAKELSKKRRFEISRKANAAKAASRAK